MERDSAAKQGLVVKRVSVSGAASEPPGSAAQAVAVDVAAVARERQLADLAQRVIGERREPAVLGGRAPQVPVE